MGKYKAQKAAHALFVKHFHSQEPFTLQEFIDATGWSKPGTYKTYLGKHYRGLTENVGGGEFRISFEAEYRVTEAFRRLLPWRAFKQHVSQVRRVVTSYEPSSSEVLIYDFLMPLTNEASLRITLDALFYKDTLSAKLKTVPEVDLHRLFPRVADSTTDDYLDGILQFIESHFVGYSISHVDGRFRSGKVLTQDEVAAFQKLGYRYLIDETTAVTRFIFPYGDEEELAKVRFLFQALFVRSIIQLVNGEEQIWMLESGPRSRVHIWQAEVEDDDEDDQEDDDEEADAENQDDDDVEVSEGAPVIEE